jgi:TolB-like protein
VELLELQGALPERYRVKRELGRGGMAIVYLAEDVPHGRDVAIKVLSPELGSSIDGERFKREIQIAARLGHPNILPAYDSGSANGLHYYVMPFIEGESLRARLDRESQLSIEDAIAIACEVSEALSYAHSQGVVHRDVKPENVLIQSGHAVVADFGIARLVQDAGGEKLTATGISIGTAAYMSPEQFSGEKVDGRSDLYSLACMLYEMLVGQVPFSGPNAMAVMARHTMQPVPSIRLVRASVPESVEEVIMRALEKVPADRFATVSEFKDALLAGDDVEGFFQSTRSYAAGHRSGNQPRRRRARRRRMLLLAGAIVAALALATVGARTMFAPRHSAFALSSGDLDARRIGVLYFADESDHGQLRYLADGLTESLIDQLSGVSALDVVSRDAVRPFRGSAVAPDSVARALHLGSVIRGSVEPAGNGVRVTVRLVDPQSNVDVAKKSIELDTTNVAAMQTKVAGEVTEFLREQLGAEVRLRDSRKGASNPQAWMLVQRAEKRRKDADSLLTAGTTEGADRALAEADQELARAESLDRGWAEPVRARAALAHARATAASGDAARATSFVDSGLAFADRALVIDARDPDALEGKGTLLFLRYQQRVGADPRGAATSIARAESTLTRAVSINKNQAGAWAALSAVHLRNSQLQLANVAAYNAYRADAYLSSAKTVMIRLFTTSYNLESFPEAMQWCNEARRRFPREPFFVECRLMMYLSKYSAPDVDSAWRYAGQYATMFPEKTRDMARRKAEVFVAGTIVRAGLADSARRVLLRTRLSPQEDPRREVGQYEIVVRVMLHEQDEAVRLLQDYLTVHPDHRAGFASRTVWWWRDLQGNPKFQALIAGAR